MGTPTTLPAGSPEHAGTPGDEHTVAHIRLVPLLCLAGETPEGFRVFFDDHELIPVPDENIVVDFTQHLLPSRAGTDAPETRQQERTPASP